MWQREISQPTAHNVQARARDPVPIPAVDPHLQLPINYESGVRARLQFPKQDDPFAQLRA
jgi:hypothetical protein